MPEPDEYTNVVAAITIVDKSIAHHQSELDRNWALRGTLADRLDAMGVTPPPAPQRATAATQLQDDPTEGERLAQEWLETLDRTGHAPMAAEAQRLSRFPSPMSTSHQAGLHEGRPHPDCPECPDDASDEPDPSWIQAYEQPDRTQPDGYTYRSVLVLTRDMPEQVGISVFAHNSYTGVPEAHITSAGRPRDRRTRVVCGRNGPNSGWWEPDRADWEPQIEICLPCFESLLRKP